MENIIEMHRAYFEAIRRDDDTAADEIVKRAHQYPLALNVQTGWNEVGATDPNYQFFQILLGTGGPAYRLWGTIDMHGCADKVEYQTQDWFEPWTMQVLDDDAQAAADWFANLFYWGE